MGIILWGFGVSLVNAFWMYSWYHHIFGITPKYSHYDFVEAVAHTWIDPINYWPTHHLLHLVLIDKNSSKLLLSENREWCKPFTDKSVCPDHGSLRKRLDNTCNHMPGPVDKSKNTQCQLHMWTAKKKSSTFDASREKTSWGIGPCLNLSILPCSSMHELLFISQWWKFGCPPNSIFWKSKWL